MAAADETQHRRQHGRHQAPGTAQGAGGRLATPAAGPGAAAAEPPAPPGTEGGRESPGGGGSSAAGGGRLRVSAERCAAWLLVRAEIFLPAVGASWCSSHVSRVCCETSGRIIIL